ncbi:MAG: UBP-type zinc finger domain-containing protein [Candidatus Limnocylindrales bacterium]
MSQTCEHIPAAIPPVTSDHCQDCDSRINLRLCGTCGYVGCCESQAGHDRDHALSAGHPVIYSIPLGQGFIWCYEHGRYVG